MTENWIDGPMRLIVTTPIIDQGTPNGIVHTNADHAAESLTQHEKTRIDILYRKRSSSWAYTFDSKTDGGASKFINGILRDSDRDNEMMPPE